MFRGLFNYDNPIFKFILLIGRIWYLNILFLLTSLPVFTIGTAVTALIFANMKLRQGDTNITVNYFNTFKNEFKQGVLLFIIYSITGIFLGFNLIFWNNAYFAEINIFWIMTLGMVLLYLISIIYVFAIQARFINTVTDTIKYSVVLAVKNIKTTIILSVILLLVLYANISSYFIVNFLTLNFGFGILSYIYAGYYNELFKKYTDN